MLLKGTVIYKPFPLGFFLLVEVFLLAFQNKPNKLFIYCMMISDNEVNCMINREKAKPMENARRQWYGHCGIVTI